MNRFEPLADRLRALFRRASVDTEMDEEMAFHLEMETKKNIQAGMDPKEARRRAMIAFGGVDRFKERTREERGVRPLENLIRDFRYGFRQIRRNPGFSVVAVLTLAVGIGGITLVFSVFHAVVLRPLPFRDADELVRIREVTPQNQLMSVSDPNFLDFRERSRSFSEMAAVYTRPLVLSGSASAVRISSMAVTEDFFRMLAVTPVLGRGFGSDEFQRVGEPPVVLLSHGFWNRQFGGDPAVLEESVVLDGVPRIVIGVLPPNLGPPFEFDVWLPFAADAGFPRGDHRREVFARLAPGVALGTGAQELSEIQVQLGREYPSSNGGWGVSVVRLQDWVVGPQATRVAQVLLAAMALLLILACASVSNLLLARAMARRREISLRAALGAGQGRLFSQFLAESSTLAFLGAVLGTLLALWALPLIRGLPSEPLPRLGEVAMNWTVLLFVVSVTVFSTLVFGTAPALHGARARIMAALKVSRPTPDRTGRMLRSSLVVSQLSLATVLLIGAGLLGMSFLHMNSVDPGFDTRNVLLVEVSAPADRYPEMSPATHLLFRELVESVESTPGVLGAGATMASPVSDSRPSNFVARAEDSGQEDRFLQVRWRAVTPGLFRALGVPLLAGRIFTDADADAALDAFTSGSEAALPVVLSRSLADRMWPEGDAVGESLVWNGPGGTPMTVMGVVGDIRDLTFPWDPEPAVYLPHRVAAWPTMTLVVRVGQDPGQVAGQIRQAVHDVDASIPMPNLRSMEDTLGLALAGPRLNLFLFSLFASAALLLAAVGLYGLTAFSVASRVREVGVRMALGAPRIRVLGSVLGHGMGLTLLGTGLGLVGAFLLTRFMEAMLFDVDPVEVRAYAAVVLILGLVTSLATLVPAMRASKVDPASVLKAE